MLSYQPGVGQLPGHGHVHDGLLCVPGVCPCHAVTGGAALGDDGRDLDPLTALDGAEGEALAVVVGLHLDEQQATGKQRERRTRGFDQSPG